LKGGNGTGGNTVDCAAQDKGKSVAACLKSRTDYAQNPDKTNKGELVSSYECSPLTADEEFIERTAVSDKQLHRFSVCVRWQGRIAAWTA